MGKTRTIQVKLSDSEYHKFEQLANNLYTSLSELGRDSFLIALPTLAERARILQEKMAA